MRDRHNEKPSFEDVLHRYISRRGFLKGASLLGASSAAGACTTDIGTKRIPSGSLAFVEQSHTIAADLAVPPGYQSQVLLAWGDPLFSGLGKFDPQSFDAGRQAKSFGYNNDFVGFLPLPLGSASSDHGLLAVNHEYTTPALMFPGSPSGAKLNRAQIDVDIAAHGLSVVEIKRLGEQWRVVLDSPYNRRITPNTPALMTGAAAGSPRLRTALSEDGISTFGTYGNCAGGVTPWGTVLTGEENVDGFFSGDYRGSPEEENYTRFGVDSDGKGWNRFYDRWNLAKNPRELMHVGWIVEIDPYDPTSKPKKRTALGRFKHEGCNVYVNKDGHVVAYTGDDQRFEYIYRFVSKDKYNPQSRAANMDLLAEGELSVAEFKDDGELHWHPLIFGQGPLTKANGFANQGDVYLDARKAADLVGATPMDRPEDVDVNAHNGRVYAMLTNNTQRKPGQVDAANPRPHNAHGQIVEFWPADGDHRRAVFRWDLFLLAGKPDDMVTLYHPDITDRGWLSCPDNCAFDVLGNLWIATDGAQKTGIADGLWATEVAGARRGLTRRFMRIPVGAELCGPFFTPDSESLFCAVQHPASGSTYEAPSTRWPDFDQRMPPRPAVVVTWKTGGGRVGS